ncbi:CBS domain-containing protein [Woeseiaceae bacterium]|jgi:magnesium and cobalt transporter|nr:CBS domain-containing protein [Woeseiaceae bacterium]MDB2544121.1 CBS domain-containing protein [Woeseiaceae bacterium]|tara:strand:- start:1695 stop:2552 length:858 start_codon:yes stop_codon:yes gene_type:complete
MNDKKQPKISEGILGFLGRIKRAIKGEPFNRREIQELLQNTRGAIDSDEEKMVSGVLDVAETQVREVMIPRSQMVVIENTNSLREILEIIVSSGHSRFPVMNKDQESCIGVLLAKDLLRHFKDAASDNIDIKRYIRPLSVIPESKRLNTLLKEFRDSHNHMAIVVDEYGGISGLLTIEDVLEEIVGEIDDEHDTQELEYIQKKKSNDGSEYYLVLALTKVEDFNDYFKCKLEQSSYDTIGGLVVHEFGRLPRNGEKLIFSNFKFSVIKTHLRRIEVLSVKKVISN